MTGLAIVILNDYGHVKGGADQVALTSAIALAKRGYATTVFGAVPPIMPELHAPNLRVVCANQHDILNDPNRLRAVTSGAWNLHAARLMNELLDELSPERTIIHAHAWTKSLSASVLRTAMRRGFKVVCTMHDYFVACPNGSFFNHPQNRICKLQALSARCLFCNCDVRSYPQKVWRFGRHLVQKHIGGVPGGIRDFIAISKLSKTILEPYLPKAARIHQLDNPIDVAKSEPVKVHENSDFIALGRIVREKGPDLFARAASALNAPAVYIRDGPMRADVLSIYPRAVITGWMPRSAVPPLVRSARALVFPSVWYEVQPLAILEAAAMGLPAIVPDTCAARDLVADGVTGLWFKGGDAGDLAHQMRRLRDDSKLAKTLGQAAYDRFWSDPPTTDRHVDRLLKIYETVLAA